jgi:hypothetical protein
MTKSAKHKEITITELAGTVQQLSGAVEALTATVKVGFKDMHKEMSVGFKHADKRREDLAILTSNEFKVVRSEMFTLKESLENKIEDVRFDLKTDISEVRTELKGDIAKVDKRLSKLEINPILQSAI